ncbi:biopolymer transporter ExbD [Maritimibacter sp. 55A14]|uniref:ExbD/TolR family protein n=1 Tax=Maritimibacter sp. 55A14 TaxID=2174844 RepID=UPI000D60ED85|nr:biopolymer transporter ExbD [Maritimibacter sp. 55A14]PWE33365.1 biopolymer transporter ExbD [Maritimibacter sp. 55A14]
MISGALRPSDPPRRPARISLTPLIDVVFILLVFFMLATRFEDWRGMPLSAGGAGMGDGLSGALVLEVAPNDVRLGGVPVDGNALETALARRAAARLLVLPRGGVSTAALVDVLDRLEAAGVAQVSLLEAAR